MNPADYQIFLDSFHFLRPWWFIALMPAILLFILITLRQGKGSSWEQAIDAELLSFIIDQPSSARTKNPVYLILLVWVLIIFALAGPVWEKTPQPVSEREDALVILFDLSQSMYAEDIKPNRLVAARRKLLDLLAQRQEGITALVVYAGDAHIVTPLTDDAKTVAEMLPAISPAIMPAAGSQLAPALTLAYKLFQDAGMNSGRVLIVTDEIRDIAFAQQLARKNRNAYPVSILAVGSAEGAPIPTPAKGYLKNPQGTLVIARVNYSAMQAFAAVAGGRFARISLLDTDLDYLLADQALINPDQFRQTERQFDIWYEKGPWLFLLILPVAAFSFRKGWLWTLALICLMPMPRAEASFWNDLWQTPDQQAATALEKGETALAAELFEHATWKGAAQYRNQDYVAAAEAYAETKTTDGQYNFGNALAKQGQYPQAIKAYENALSLDPDNSDARFNKQLIEDLLKQQEQEQQQQDDGEEQQGENQEQNQEGENGKQSQSDSDNQQSKDKNADAENESAEDQNSQQNSSQQNSSKQNDQSADEDPEKSQPTDPSEPQPQNADPQQTDSATASDISDIEQLNDEQQQALQQWLRRVPDDPAGLLRRKFEIQHNERRHNEQQNRGGRIQNDSSNW
ncbi:MAG: VWA domain-containing protein [Pseudomonadales bacterium]|nr:VWA domain-containing protein [Pseudomonadales bacterium]